MISRGDYCLSGLSEYLQVRWQVDFPNYWRPPACPPHRKKNLQKQWGWMTNCTRQEPNRNFRCLRQKQWPNYLHRRPRQRWPNYHHLHQSMLNPEQGEALPAAASCAKESPAVDDATRFLLASLARRRPCPRLLARSPLPGNYCS
jgi:hypothetical protein